MAEPIQISVRLEPKGEGWPPAEVLWAEPMGEDRFRIVNAPFFADLLAVGHVVEGVRDDRGRLWARQLVQASGRVLIRLLPGVLADEEIFDVFNRLGVRGESARPMARIIALDVPADADFAAVKALLIKGEHAGWWEYEEPCITGAWAAA